MTTRAARYEITGTATDKYTTDQICDALKAVGADRVGRRYAFGWSNQSRVATFRASSDRDAKELCEAARALLGPGELPALIPTTYS